MRPLLAVTWMSLRTVPSRWGSSLVVVVGMACAVGALVSILSMSAGFLRTMAATGSPSRAIVMSDGALGEWGSTIAHDEATILSDMPGVARDGAHKPVVSADYFAYTAVSKKSDRQDSYVDVRGVSLQDPGLRPEIKLINGRWFHPGHYEIVVGKSAQDQFEGLKVGDHIALPSGDWLVTGTFESNGSANESEMITDVSTLLSAMRTSAYNSMTVRLTSPAAFTTFKNAITTRPGPALEISRESDFYAQQSKSFDDFLKTIAYVVGGIMGLGATFGALNTVYSAIAARAREIATLRAIGFGGATVMVSVMSEALLFCLIGAGLGVLFAWALFNGYQHAMGGLVIRLAVTPALAATGIGFALALGAIGGVFPAARAARMPIVDALRAV
ncbi:MAG TPA: ABC transporter permease [Rhizomicrobium sp.]|nr:ABC transporter permease [Rhizomicrobium sp.]